MKNIKAKPMSGIYWAYFAADGYLQVRTIAETKKLAREMIAKWRRGETWKDYEMAGYFLERINVNISII